MRLVKPLSNHDTKILSIMREGYDFALLHSDNWFAGVNRCPYGLGIPSNELANAWYRGWWFYFYNIKPLRDLK